jgi:hypothetical protein
MAKRGRPTGPAGRKSAQLSIRIAPDLRAKLEAVVRADESGRSLSQEIEARLRLSFGEEQRRQDEFGGPTTYWLFRILAGQIGGIEHDTGHRFWKDRYTFEECIELVVDTFKPLKPSGRRKVPKDLEDFPLGKHRAAESWVLLTLVVKGDLDLGPAMFNAAAPLIRKLKLGTLESIGRRHSK